MSPQASNPTINQERPLSADGIDRASTMMASESIDPSQIRSPTTSFSKTYLSIKRPGTAIDPRVRKQRQQAAYRLRVESQFSNLLKAQERDHSSKKEWLNTL